MIIGRLTRAASRERDINVNNLTFKTPEPAIAPQHWQTM